MNHEDKYIYGSHHIDKRNYRGIVMFNVSKIYKWVKNKIKKEKKNEKDN